MDARYNDPSDYVMVGGEYYRKCLAPYDMNSDKIELLPWPRSQINEDFRQCPEKKRTIERYDGFCNIPEHLNYRRRIGDFYNLYEDIQHIPKPGEWETTRAFFEHIFGDMVDVGYDYFTLLLKNPYQPLPVLLLVSKEKQTGKTTFLNYLSAFFRGNVAMVTNDELRSHFNSSWVTKLIVMIDETLLNRKEDSERIKALSTARMGMLESKGKDRRSVRMFLKIVLCSNNPDCPVWIEEDDDRYLVLDVPSLQKKDPFLFEKLVAEIPAFMHFLINRTMKYPEPQERMWFPMKELETPALMRVKRACGPKGEIDLAEILLSIMEHYQEDKLEYTLKDINELLKCHDIRINVPAREIVRKRWQLEPAPSNMTYWRCNLCPSEGELIGGQRCKGRYFTFTREFVEKILREKDWKR